MPSYAVFVAAVTCLASPVVATNLQLPLPLKSLDCSDWPAQYGEVAPPNPTFTEMYDLTGIPDIPINNYPSTGNPCTFHKTSQLPGYCNAECGCTDEDLVIRECANPALWAATYDDGPTEFTREVLDALQERRDMKAMFFVIGSNVCRNPEVLVEAVNAGHEIGIHTWSHRRLSGLKNEEIIAEMKYTEDAIVALTGVKPKYVRPPYGNADARVKFILDKMGYTVVNWNQDTNDWEYNFKPNTAKNFNDATKSIVGSVQQYISDDAGALKGTISLQHDIAMIPTSLAGAVLDEIIAAGWNTVPLAQCLNSQSWFVSDAPILDSDKTAGLDSDNTAGLASLSSSPQTANSSGGSLSCGLATLFTILFGSTSFAVVAI